MREASVYLEKDLDVGHYMGFSAVVGYCFHINDLWDLGNFCSRFCLKKYILQQRICQ